MSRVVLLGIAAVLGIIILSGCDRQSANAAIRTEAPGPQLIASGELLNVTLWEKPVQRANEDGSNSGNTLPKGSRVSVYANFILVTDSAGVTKLSLNGWYTDLRFKADPQ